VPATALALALAAAALHAGWNILIARAGDPEGAGAAAILIGVAAFAPVAALTWRVEWAAVPYIGASAAAELAYFALLAAAYRRYDLSVVYPIARGAAPVLVLVVAVVATSAQASALEVAGVAIVAVGIMLVRGVRVGGGWAAPAMALGVAACIAAYTVIDKSGLHHAAAIPYLEITLATSGLLYAAGLAYARGPQVVRAGFSRWTAGAGVGMFLAYALVLAALRLAPAASVAAVRETSVVMATALAAAFLGEPVSRGRAAGSVLVAAGIVALALA
jgi:drug/metabolite transporter (DMT)-like permease